MTTTTMINLETKTAEIFNILSDPITLHLFEYIIGQGQQHSQKLTRKQYYSRIKLMQDTGLIIRVAKKQYAITNLGTIARHIIELTERALQSREKMHVIDAFQLQRRKGKIKGVDEEMVQELIRDIIKDKTIENIILSPIRGVEV